MDKQTAINKINALAPKGIPFFFVIDFEMKKNHVWPLDQLPKDILISFPRWNNSPVLNYEAGKVVLKKHAIHFNAYKHVFDRIKNELIHGNSYLTNLTFPTPIETNLSFMDIFLHSQAPYKLCFQNQFVVFSPESFVRIAGHKISTSPMKGTIDLAVKNAEQQLLDDEKETAEHHTIVDLMRNDLSLIARGVEVEKFRYVEQVVTHERTLLQTSSLISGLLPEGYKNNLGDMLFSLLPAGSISGAPKKETLRIISTCETYHRGYYTGVMGLYDGENLDSAVMIRFIEKSVENGLIFKSGGGITSTSDAKKEYQEMIDKVYVPVY
ncbi:MAG: aminodeoxychorismate synthase component I [Cyclobacteriaceae bacterium]|nr:aminodeoxychorismate synthase component I [Cyclobacteriaceae bacterium]